MCNVLGMWRIQKLLKWLLPDVFGCDSQNKKVIIFIDSELNNINILIISTCAYTWWSYSEYLWIVKFVYNICEIFTKYWPHSFDLLFPLKRVVTWNSKHFVRMLLWISESQFIWRYSIKYRVTNGKMAVAFYRLLSYI